MDNGAPLAGWVWAKPMLNLRNCRPLGIIFACTAVNEYTELRRALQNGFLSLLQKGEVLSGGWIFSWKLRFIRVRVRLRPLAESKKSPTSGGTLWGCGHRPNFDPQTVTI